MYERLERREITTMDYKKVLENQIEELEKYQKTLITMPGTGETICEIAKTIVRLIENASNTK
jgi:hypothetical protein